MSDSPPPTEGLPVILQVPDVAKWLNLPEATVRKLAYERQLPGWRCGKRWLFDAADLRDWVAENSLAAKRACEERRRRRSGRRRGESA